MTEPTRREDYRPPDFLIDRVDLDFELDVAATRVDARLAIRRNPRAGNPRAPLHLDGEELTLESLALDGERLPADSYRHDARGLTLADVPDRCTLTTRVVIHPERNTELMGLYRAGDILCTQCEPEAFRRITFFADRPDVMAVFRTTLTADAGRYPVLLANGNPVAHETLADGRHRRVWHDPFPKPSYLFALVAGDLHRVEDRVTTAAGDGVAVHIHVEPRNRDRCGHAMDTAKRAMAWDEAHYGCAYDLEVFNAVAVSAYTMGAMENKGLNIFNDRYVLASAQTATDRDYRDIEALVAHEYLHNWSGNRVTCRDWFQLAIKEGFTVFREQQFVADQGWHPVRRLEDAALIRTRQFAEDAGPMAHPVRPAAYRRIDNFYTDTVYSKGAELIRMLTLLLGPKAFRAGTDRFFGEHDGEAVTVEDFLDCMARASGRDLAQFARWYDRAGTPALAVTAEHDPDRAVLTLTVRQLPPAGANAGEPLHMPLALALLDADGNALPLRLEGEDRRSGDERVLELRQEVTRFHFQDIRRPPVPSLLRGFSAPVRLEYDYRDGELALLACRDDDAYARWDAVQRLAARGILAAAAGRETASEPLVRVFSHILERADRDPGLAAHLLTLPAENALALQTHEPEYERLYRARESLKAELGRRLAPSLQAAIREPGDGRPGPPTPHTAGWRALSDLCLDYRVASGDPEALDRCLRQYGEAGSMTERLGALSALAQSGGAHYDDSLEDFRRRWRHEPLVMDKWLALQARSPHGDTLGRVETLMDGPAFSLSQPNRVRSLVEVFCSENPRHFHRQDGAGYRLLADCVLAIDPDNPPLAAGLLRHLIDWRRQAPDRRRRMRAQLTRVAQSPALSGMCTEIAAIGLDG